jgi:hypothetical protein
MSLNSSGLNMSARVAMNSLTGPVTRFTQQLEGRDSAMATIRAANAMLEPKNLMVDSIQSSKDLLSKCELGLGKYDLHLSKYDLLGKFELGLSKYDLVSKHDLLGENDLLSKYETTLGKHDHSMALINRAKESFVGFGMDALRSFGAMDRALDQENRLQKMLGLGYQHNRLCQRLVDEPAFAQFVKRKRTVAPTPAPTTLTLEPRCFFCSGPVGFAEAEVTSVSDHQLLGRLAVLPCPTCLRRILENPEYMIERLAGIAVGKDGPPALTSVDGGRQGDGIARGKGILHVVRDESED